ncbi:MAG: hypothetical protein AAF902_04845 [Chloroflexota bacterium]
MSCASPTPQSIEREGTDTQLGPVKAEAGLVIVQPPAGYSASNGRSGVTLNGVGEFGEKLIGIKIQTALGTASSLDNLIDDYMNDLPDSWNGVISDETIGGLNGRSTGYALEESGELSVTGRAAAVSDGKFDYLIFAIMHQNDWISGGSLEFNEVVTSVVFDDVAEAAENSPRVVENLPEATPVPEEETDPEALFEIPPFAGQSADGYACFGGFDSSLICILPSGEIRHFTAENSAMDVDSVYNLHACSDGRIVQVDVRGLKLFDGETFRRISGPADQSGADLARCGPNLELWMTNFNGAHVNRGNGWETFTKEEIFVDGDTLLNQIQIGPDGTAWVISFNEVAYLPPNQMEWVAFAEGDGFDEQYFLDGLMLDDDGTPFVSHSNGLLWFDDNQWNNLDSNTFWSTISLAQTADNQIYITTLSDGIVVTNRQEIQYVTTADGLTRNGTEEIQIDGRGRIWITHELGLDVNDGSAWQSLRMDNTLIPYSDYLTLVVVGEGPQLPAIVQEEDGSVVGKLVSPSGRVMANTAVEMCVDGYVSAFGLEDSPCGDDPLKFSTETDETGRFLINSVPSSWYEIFYFVGENDEWQALYRPDATFLDQEILVESAEQLDLGTIQALEDE